MENMTDGVVKISRKVLEDAVTIVSSNSLAIKNRTMHILSYTCVVATYRDTRRVDFF